MKELDSLRLVDWLGPSKADEAEGFSGFRTKCKYGDRKIMDWRFKLSSIDII